ncbi:thialysine N-epsilon-acetyltransferase [Malaya genurostris]|uniref:thialysine N-epsilon-acetyltransferase n=1 Tax=Malaya genurostris TaxID=325434 RepID=UPI0026F3CBF1|nr:thialysine N-epsilon-acetyltransferase [Malaya genurostris]
MSVSSNVVVRKTTKKDLGDIINMIQELADFEGMSNGPQLTVEKLARDGGFDEASPLPVPIFHSFVLELTESDRTEDNKEKFTSSVSNEEPLTRTSVIGYAIYFYSYSTWQGKSLFLEDLYVKTDFRNLGYGKLLFRTVARHARETDCMRLDFHVLAWNPAKKFYHRMGAENLTESEQWELFRLSRKAIDRIEEN